MYTRVVELTSKSGKARELCNTIDDKVLPILTRQAGFVDETVIVSDTEPNRVLALSFWRTREDAQRYEREQFDAMQRTVQHLLETAPVVRTFDVHASTAHKVTAERPLDNKPTRARGRAIRGPPDLAHFEKGGTLLSHLLH
jgi:heme-degrading monooxygenase HmoA